MFIATIVDIFFTALYSKLGTFLAYKVSFRWTLCFALLYGVTFASFRLYILKDTWYS